MHSIVITLFIFVFIIAHVDVTAIIVFYIIMRNNIDTCACTVLPSFSKAFTGAGVPVFHTYTSGTCVFCRHYMVRGVRACTILLC